MNIYSNILLYGGLVIFVGFYILFSRNIKMLTTDEFTNFKHSASRRNIYVTVALFVALYYFENFNIRLLIALSIIIYMTLEGWLQKLKLKREQFNPEFMRSMGKAELLSYVAVTMILAGFVISAKV